jgi:hypothetical protein
MSTSVNYSNTGIIVNSINAISILSNNSVGINNSNPNSAYSLDVFGSIRTTSDAVTSGNLIINGGGSFNGGWYMSDSTYIRALNVGISTVNTYGGSWISPDGSQPYLYTSGGLDINFTDVTASNYIQFVVSGSAHGLSYFVSDITLKENFQPINISACDLFEKIDYFSYNFKDSPAERINLGFSAQQLQSIEPQFINVMSDGILNINTNIFSTYMTKALQELIVNNNSQNTNLSNLESSIITIKNILCI